MPKPKAAIPAIVDLHKLEPAIKQARKWVQTYKTITGKTSPLIEEIAEFDAAKHLDLVLNRGGSTGYQGERLLKGELDLVIIKAKQTRAEGPAERIGKFPLSGLWTSAALVLLDGKFEPTSIYVVPKIKLKELATKAEAKAKKEGKKKADGLTLGDFKAAAGKPAWIAKKAARA